MNRLIHEFTIIPTKDAKRVAIVGSREKYWSPRQRAKAVKRIKTTLFRHMDIMVGHYESVKNTRSVILISGRCPYGGVDVWAEVIADLYDIPKQIYPPKKGVKGNSKFFDRNIEIAEACDVLYCFQPVQKPKGGGTWTMEQAENLGKECYLEVIE